MKVGFPMNPPGDVQKTGMEDAASRPRFRTFSAGALNFHSNEGKSKKKTGEMKNQKKRKPTQQRQQG